MIGRRLQRTNEIINGALRIWTNRKPAFLGQLGRQRSKGPTDRGNFKKCSFPRSPPQKRRMLKFPQICLPFIFQTILLPLSWWSLAPSCSTLYPSSLPSTWMGRKWSTAAFASTMGSQKNSAGKVWIFMWCRLSLIFLTLIFKNDFVQLSQLEDPGRAHCDLPCAAQVCLQPLRRQWGQSSHTEVNKYSIEEFILRNTRINVSTQT